MKARHRVHPARPVLAAASAAACALALLCAQGPPAAASPASAAPPIYLNTDYSFQERAADLVSRMTLQEKVQQLSTNSGAAVPRLGVQQYTYWSEGQHGVNTLGADSNNGGATGGVHATSFPTNFAASMSWDRNLVYDETTAISDEARGFLDKSLWGQGQNNLGPSADDYGSLTFWAPNVNLDRDPRWGRTDEAFGEDPYQVSQMAGQYVDGYQGNDRSGKSSTGYLKVAATAKHYALNNVEQDRTGISSDVNDTDLRDYYTKQFKGVIEDAHVSGLMTSYNAINGTPSVADTYTTNELAQRTYGFGGYITSDCGAVGTTWRQPTGGHDWAAPGWSTDHDPDSPTWTNAGTGAKISGQAGGQAYALRAGTDLNCTGDEATTPNIQQALDSGALSEGVLDQALVRVFTVRMETGEFDPADKVPYTKITKDQIQSRAHQDLAEKVAANSLVLLKNDKPSGADKPLLPVSGPDAGKVVVLGDLANKVTLGGYSGDPGKQVSAVQGITDELKAEHPGASVVFDAAGTSTTATGDATLSDQTKSDIKSADLVVVFVGTDDSTAHEGQDRKNLDMPGNYDSLVNQVSALGNDKLALVVQSDGPVKLDDVQGKVPSVVFSGYNGESQGAALADVLFGKQNPSGHLNFTWYKDASQLPTMSDYGLTADETGGIGRTYQYFTGQPTYPFGYGLSYSDFAYSGVRADKSSVTADGTVAVSFDVKNTGSAAGATVAQLYAATPFTVSGVQLPKERLVGFEKTRVLQPGETQHVTLQVKAADLSMWDAKSSRQVVHHGTYKFQVGPDSATVAGSASVDVTGSLTPKVQYVTVQPENVVYNAGDTIDLTGKNRWIKDDTDPSEEQRDTSITADNVVEAVNNDQSFVDLTKQQPAYRSSDTSVATVTADGKVKAVGDGVATITATVGGVSGSAVIVVRNSLKLEAKPIAEAGSSFTATTTYTNGGDQAVRNVAVALSGPSGWTAKATTPSSFSEVPAGKSVRTQWQVQVPSGADPSAQELTAQATADGAAARTAAAPVSVPYASVDAARNNTGATPDNATTGGNLDGGGASLSADALSAAGYPSGGKPQHDGITFSWPTTDGKSADNIVAGGQAVEFSGSGGHLGFLGDSTFGTASGTGTILYTDGTPQQYSLALGDWWAGSAAQGSDIAATLPYINNSGGRQTQQVHLYGATVPLKAGKTVQALTLPNVSQKAVNGSLAMHIFAIGTG